MEDFEQMLNESSGEIMIAGGKIEFENRQLRIFREFKFPFLASR